MMLLFCLDSGLLFLRGHATLRPAAVEDDELTEDSTHLEGGDWICESNRLPANRCNGRDFGQEEGIS